MNLSRFDERENHRCPMAVVLFDQFIPPGVATGVAHLLLVMLTDLEDLTRLNQPQGLRHEPFRRELSFGPRDLIGRNVHHELSGQELLA